MQSYHRVHARLSRKDRQQVAAMLRKGQESARVLRRASILRQLDDGQKLAQVSEAPAVTLCLQTRTSGHFIVAEPAEMVDSSIKTRHSRPIYGCSLGQFMSVVTYLSKVRNTIYVLHSFKKESRKTDRRDIEVAGQRLKLVMQRLQEQKAHEKRSEK